MFGSDMYGLHRDIQSTIRKLYPKIILLNGDKFGCAYIDAHATACKIIISSHCALRLPTHGCERLLWIRAKVGSAFFVTEGSSQYEEK